MSDLIQGLKGRLEAQRSAPGGFDPVEDLTRILAAIPNRIEMLEALLSTARRSFLADHCVILSYHRPTERWFLEAQHGLDAETIEAIKSLSWTVIRGTAEAAQTLLIRDALSHDLTQASQSIRTHNIRSVLCAPIHNDQGHVWGVIYLDSAGIPNVFDDQTQRRLETFARFAGIAIRRCDDLIRLSRPFMPGIQEEMVDEEPLYDFPSPAMQQAMELLRRAAPHDVPILLVGETGTGKDVLARWIHESSPRRQGPFGHVNCANISPTLVEAELFGIEKRRATGVDFQEGRLKLIDGGTAFLNEIGELPLSIQAKILRVIEEKVVDRVGGINPVGVDVRFVCATNRDLAAMVKQGHFRSDLYFRINVFEVRVPPLRERPEDIPPLAEHLLRRECRRHNRRPMRIPKTTLRQLAAMPWEGNIRELAHFIERGVILLDGEEFITDPPSSPAGFSHGDGARMPGRTSLPEVVSKLETELIGRTLREEGWNIRHAASRLGVPPSTLRSKIKALGIKRPATLQ